MEPNGPTSDGAGAHSDANGVITVTLVVPGAELAGEAMFGDPQYGARSNARGVVPVVLVFTFSWLLNGGTTYCGRVESKVTGSVPDVGSVDTPAYGVCVVVRGSSWYVSGSTPVFFEPYPSPYVSSLKGVVDADMFDIEHWEWTS